MGHFKITNEDGIQAFDVFHVKESWMCRRIFVTHCQRTYRQRLSWVVPARPFLKRGERWKNTGSTVKCFLFMKKATRIQSPETLSGSSQHLIHSSSFHENSHTCVHTYTETHRNMQVHTQTHTHIQTDTGTQIHARTHTDRQMQAHTYTDKYTYTHLNKKLN